MTDIDWDTPVGYSHAERLRRTVAAAPKPAPFEPDAVDRRAEIVGVALIILGGVALVAAAIGTVITR